VNLEVTRLEKRVAVVSPLLLSPETGAGRKILLAIEVLRELGCRVTVFIIKGGMKLGEDIKTIELDDYKIDFNRSIAREMEREFSLLRKYSLRILAPILRGKFDIVQIHSPTRAMPQVAAFLAAKITGAKVVYYLHDLLPDTAVIMRGLSPNSLLYKLVLVFEKMVFKLSNIIIVVSDTMKTVLVRRHGERYWKRVRVIYPYADLEPAGPGIDRHLIEKYGIPQGKKVIAYVGKLEPKCRGLEDLITAFGKLTQERRNEAYLLLVGAGIAAKELDRMAVEQGVKDRVVFTGNLPHEEATELMREAEIAVIPLPESIAAHIAIPTKIVEYIAAGKLIVTSKLMQIRRILGEDAIYYDPKSSNSLADALEKALTSLNKLRKMRKRVQGKARVFDKDVVKRELKELYKCIGS
jgi:glycosyltransferase involved in cell wall biosynthesis